MDPKINSVSATNSSYAASSVRSSITRSVYNTLGSICNALGAIFKRSCKNSTVLNAIAPQINTIAPQANSVPDNTLQSAELDPDAVTNMLSNQLEFVGKVLTYPKKIKVIPKQILQEQKALFHSFTAAQEKLVDLNAKNMESYDSTTFRGIMKLMTDMGDPDVERDLVVFSESPEMSDGLKMSDLKIYQERIQMRLDELPEQLRRLDELERRLTTMSEKAVL